LHAAESVNTNWYQAAEKSRSERNWTSCAQRYLKAAEQSPEFWQAWLGHAVCLNELGNRKEALSALNRAQLVEPYSIEIMALRASIQTEMGKQCEALRTYRLIIEAAENHTGQLEDPRNRSTYARALVRVAMYELVHGDYRQGY
jgi:tetratricopeptide (TPR) repeat protein